VIIIRPALALACVCVGILAAQPYTLESVVMDGGGSGQLRSTSYAACLSVAQRAASGVLRAGQYRATLGFWHQIKAGDGVAEEVGQAASPLVFRMNQNMPNPFGRHTAIRYALPQESDVALRVYNSAGRVVTTLVQGRQKAGNYSVSWNVSRVPRAVLPNGTYFCRLDAGEFTATRKMVKSE
jgi:hypothetical protein